MAAKKKTTKKLPKTTARTYYPAKTFDDDLVALVDVYTSRSWSFTNVDLTKLTQDSKDQRTQRQSYDAAAAAWQATHSQFGSDQEARYQRFSAALSAARGAFKNDKTVTALLAKFTRSATRKAKAAAAPPKPAGA